MYCFKCGNDMGTVSAYPHTCSKCAIIHYKNPIPVVVGLIPVRNTSPAMKLGQGSGLVLVQRIGGRSDGKLALPGGFMDINDLSIGHAISREIREETQLEIDPASWKVIGHERATDGNLLIILQTSQTLEETAIRAVPDGVEIAAVKVGFDIEEPLAFPLHEKYYRHFINAGLLHFPATQP